MRHRSMGFDFSPLPLIQPPTNLRLRDTLMPEYTRQVEAVDRLPGQHSRGIMKTQNMTRHRGPPRMNKLYQAKRRGSFRGPAQLTNAVSEGGFKLLPQGPAPVFPMQASEYGVYTDQSGRFWIEEQHNGQFYGYLEIENPFRLPPGPIGPQYVPVSSVQPMPPMPTGTAAPGVPTEAAGTVQPVAMAPEVVVPAAAAPKSGWLMPLAVLGIGAMLLKGD